MLQRKKAFTLVELLVVIGIIALLIAILLPALNKARQQAYTVQCQSNMRQVMMGFQFYADQYDGRLPYQRIVGDFDWSRTILAAMVGEKLMPNSTTGSTNGVRADYFRCPLDDKRRVSTSIPAGTQIRSYAINSEDSGEPPTGTQTNYFIDDPKYHYPWPWNYADTSKSSKGNYGTPSKVAEIPAKVFILCEIWDSLPALGPQTYVGQSTFSYFQFYYSMAHPSANGMGGNYGYLDGHIEFHSPKEFRVDLTNSLYQYRVPTSAADAASMNMIEMNTPSDTLGCMNRDPFKWISYR